MIKKTNIKLSQRTIILIILLVIALLSIFVVSKVVTTPSFNQESMQSLDDKRNTVLKLAATTAAASTVLTLIPGDVAMPIANQIAELSSYFIIVLCAILLEKMLLTVVGYLSFTYIIPFACFLGALYLYIQKDILKVFAIKLAIFAIVLFTAIPISVHISDLIYSNYQESIEEAVEITEKNTEYIEEKKNNLSQEDKNWIEKVGDYVSNITSKIGVGISEITKKGEETLSRLLESIAILMIVSCGIPIFIILIFIWIIKILFGFNIEVKGARNLISNKLREHRSSLPRISKDDSRIDDNF